MESPQFERLKAEVTTKASASQILELDDTVRHVISQQVVGIALARRTRAVIDAHICPRCGSSGVVRHGLAKNGRQRFKCRTCQRTYNIMTGTPMARARKPEKWCNYLNFMTYHMTVRKIVAAGIGVNHVTVWRWRHRFLHATANKNATVLSGVIEADEIFFAKSFKGRRGHKRGKLSAVRVARSQAAISPGQGSPQEHVPVLTAIDNSGAAYEAILSSSTDIATALGGRIAEGSVLCSRAKPVYEEILSMRKSPTRPVRSIAVSATKPACLMQRKSIGISLRKRIVNGLGCAESIVIINISRC